MKHTARTTALALLLTVAPSCNRGIPQAESVLLITLDTTRADALGAYGAAEGATPNLDRLAAESVVFDAAFTVAPITQPSHASMLTGLYPLRHGIRDNGLATLPESARTLAELARESGRETAAFVAAVVLDAAFGLDQGFDVYDAPARQRGSSSSHIKERSAGDVVEAALAWWQARDPERPFFLWVHLFDPHAPYAPPSGFDRGARDARGLYAGEVSYMDRQLGRLLGTMEASGAFERATVMVVGDHGESFEEHGEPSHGAYCYMPTLHVPFVLRHPGGAGGGKRSTAVVSVVDVLPTLADALGLAVPPDLDGRSLLRELPPDRGVYFESYSGYLVYGWSPLAGWIDGDGKYLHSSEPQYFRWREDMAEEHDRIAEVADALPRYRRALERLSTLPVLVRAESGDDAQGVDPELESDLRALGYAASGSTNVELPAPLDPSDRPSPQSCVEPLRDALLAQTLVNQGELERAEELLRGVLATNEEHYFALDRLASCLILQGRQSEAIAPLRRLLADGPQWAGSWFNLGLCLQRTGRLEEALPAFRRAVELEPTQELFVDRLAEAEAEAAGR